MYIRPLILVVIFAVALTACTKRPPPGPTPAMIAATAAAKVAAERQDAFERIQRFASDHPGEIEGIRRRVKDFLPDVQGTELESPLQRLLRDAEEGFQGLCKEYFEGKIKGRIKRYEEEEDFATAVEVIDAYDPKWMLPEIETELEEMRDRFERERQADNDYYEVKKKANEWVRQGEFDRGLATIRAYIENPRYSGTKAAKRIEPLIAEIEGKKAESVEMEAEAERGWEAVGDWDFGGTEDNWEVTADGLVGKNNSDGPIFAKAGATDWANYAIQFRFKLLKGEFYFGCRGQNSPGTAEWNFSRTESPGADYERGTWYEIRCEVSGGTIRWIRRDNLKVRSFQATAPRGPMAFLVLPGCEVHFKAVQVKHK